ncbi:MAG TPA: potassium-transporting ATPase subunit KdpC [Mycobacteriales bacterium]|nr:potassium-transporting ATPase subunit KdpC [Mycobacteriales bacterium]
MIGVSSFVRQSFAGLRLLLVLTVVLGLLYPAAVLLAGRLVPGRADGSLLRIDSHVAGSTLVGQSFNGAEWFLPRPSAAGAGYDPLASGASDLGPESPALLAEVQRRRALIAAREGVAPAQVPADALTASGSGLDPDISPAYAELQVNRVAAARGLDPAVIRRLVAAARSGPDLGFIGAPRVNVVELNAAVQALDERRG